MTVIFHGSFGACRKDGPVWAMPLPIHMGKLKGGAMRREGGTEMSELDDLVASPGVLMAGRFGADGRVAEHKTAGLYVENPALTGIAQWFCAAVTTMFGSMAYAVDTLTQSGFSQSSWLPVRSWIYSGGDYAIAVHGDRFVIGERAKLGSLDELSQLLRAGQP
jgi:roadblock/LC7 domain-containing protein